MEHSGQQEPIRKPRKYNRREPKNKPGLYEGMQLSNGSGNSYERKHFYPDPDATKARQWPWRDSPLRKAGLQKRAWRNAKKAGRLWGSRRGWGSGKQARKEWQAKGLKV